MNDDYLIRRIGKWLDTELPRESLPGVVELRSGSEVVDAFEVTTETVALELAKDMVDSAHDDASDEGRSRNYTLIAILQGDMRYPCPASIRCRKGNKAVDSLAKMMTDTCSMLLKFSERLDASHKRMSEENERNAARQSEVLARLEDLRSKQLERDLALKKEEKSEEIKERITDALIPLAMAMGSRFTKGALPAPSTEDMLLVQTVKSLSLEQLPMIRSITGEQWPAFERIIKLGLEGQADVKGFVEASQSLSPEQMQALIQCMNMGQQAALGELFNGRNNGN